MKSFSDVSRKNAVFFVVVLLLSISPLLVSAQEVGRIEYLDGIVDIHRGGEIVELFPSDIGFSLEALDTIQTGPDGTVQFSISTQKRRGTSVSVGNNTTFLVEASLEPGGTKTRIEVFTGSLSLKVARLTGREELSVRTESAVMGVRGTEFEVITAPDGGVLVLCEDGSVSCQDQNQREMIAAPGTGVEKVRGQSISSVDVDPEEYGEFRRKWRETRMEIFRSGAPVFFRAYIQQFRRTEPRFSEAYAELEGFDTRLKDYARRSSEGPSSIGSGELYRFRAEISPSLARMRSIIPLYRQTFFRLAELLHYYQESGIAGDEVIDGVKVSNFFMSFQQSLRRERLRIARVENWFKLYRGLGGEGQESLMDEFFGPGEGSLLDEF
ncbi:FecR family protein [Marispirochaeta aestuarii]|uniref:FecR family protein n=1 Tax=Marispirochaeta aestuarii TaxID=1963862 RepID=UPI0029C92E20|nr:FecR family protein [Marispirochaeta aestuarii]